MTRAALHRRLTVLQNQVPTGCPACQTAPMIVILHGDDPEPADTCPVCGARYAFRRVIRLVRVDQGPQ